MNGHSSLTIAAIAIAAFCILFGSWEAYAQDYGVLITPRDPATSKGTKAATDAWSMECANQ